MKQYVKLFEDYMHNSREDSEMQSDTNEVITAVQAALENFKPFFEYDGHETDSELRNDGSGDWDVWVEYNNVAPEEIDDLDQKYQQFHDDFAEWFGKTMGKFNATFDQVLNTQNSITYSVIVSV